MENPEIRCYSNPMREIKSLTSLRGVFAMWVLLFHLGRWSPTPGWDDIPFISRGYLAVDFFFVLSGFILARRHGAEFTADPLGSYWPFLVKRIARLFPLHLLVLACATAALAVNHDLPYWRYAVDEALLVHMWKIFPASGTSINPPDWSISTEWAASLLFPAFALLGLRRAGAAACLGALGVAGVLIVAGDSGWRMDASSSRGWLPLSRCLSEFAIGVIVARGVFPAWLARVRYFLIPLIGLVAAAILGVDVLAVAMLVPMVGALAWDRGAVAGALSWGPLHWLGRVSYSIYLVQVPTLLTVRMAARAVGHDELLVFFVGSIAAVLGVAALSNAFVEKYGGRSVRYVLRTA
jgi:peptidoglycan/LPS O-acetylase OafA/YrhL